eukprot:jgi/Ulvmu1/1164/UM107_0038.1
MQVCMHATTRAANGARLLPSFQQFFQSGARECAALLPCLLMSATGSLSAEVWLQHMRVVLVHAGGVTPPNLDTLEPHLQPHHWCMREVLETSLDRLIGVWKLHPELWRLHPELF